MLVLDQKSKETFSYILGNGNPEKIPDISGNRIFYITDNGNPKNDSLITENGNPKKILILQEAKLGAQNVKRTRS